MNALILIHGRSQENKDAAALKAEWVESLAAGFEVAGLDIPVEAIPIKFPYFGDTLAALTAARSEIPDVIVKGGSSEVEDEFSLTVLKEVQKACGLTDELIAVEAGHQVRERGFADPNWVRALLCAVDRHVPFASAQSIGLFTRDVYQYLYNPGVRDRIEVGIRAAFGNEPSVVVAHSLGSVVAYNLLAREGVERGWRVPAFITVGCPLAVTAIRKALQPISHPACVDRWFNARDPRDIVALYPLTSAEGWSVLPPIDNYNEVDNKSRNRHGISGYLGDRRVANEVCEALSLRVMRRD